MMAKVFDYAQNKMLDLVPLFQAAPTENYLLQNLGIFEKVPSESIYVAVDRLIEDNASLLNKETKRFSPEHNSTKRSSYSGFQIELPHFAREDTLSAADFQKSGRVAGSDRSESRLEILADYVKRHAKAHNRTLETYYANALFKGKVAVEYTDDAPLIDYADSFDAPFMTASIDLSDDTTPVIRIFNEYLDQVTNATGGMWSDVKRTVVFAGANFFNALRFHPSLEKAYAFVSPFDPQNITTQRQELLPNVQTFSLPGMSVDVIKVTDPLLTPYIGINEAIMLPVFQPGTNVAQHVYGPASRDTNLAASGVTQEYFSYVYEKQRGESEVVSEASILPINHGTGFTMIITNSAS